MKTRFGSNHNHHFAGADKMVTDGKGAVPKMELDEKDAGGLLGETKADLETKDK